MNFKDRLGRQFHITAAYTWDYKEVMLTILNIKKDYGDTLFIPTDKVEELYIELGQCIEKTKDKGLE
jgi:hypothetical protein